MAGSAVAFWPGGNVIPEIIALAFSCAGSLPHVCARVRVLAQVLYLCHAHGVMLMVISAASGRRRGRSAGGVRTILLLWDRRSAPKRPPHRLGLSTNRGN